MRPARFVWLVVGCAAIVSLVLFQPRASAAQEQERSPEQALADRFSPYVMVKEQSEPCDTNGEPFVPTAVEVMVGNPQVALRQVGRGDPIVMWGPTAADLAGLGEGFYLDAPGSALSPGCVYETDFERYSAGRRPTVYAHIVQPDGEPDTLYLQYWLYWYFNDWNNKHESDWEGITVKFAASSVEAALGSQPVAVGYAQHEGGELAAWGAEKLDRVGDHPVVYSSARSHASYFSSAIYLGRSAGEGFGCDDTDGPSREVRPEVVLVPDRVDDPDHPLAWVDFGGRWGERQSGPFNGPTGPAMKERWLDPTPWFDTLRESSVVVPAGDSAATGLITVFCGVVEAGSGALTSFTASPARVLVTMAVVAALGRLLARRTAWDVVPGVPIVRRRRAGQILRVAAVTYRDHPLAFVAFGVIYLPAAVVTGVLGAAVERLPLVGSLLSLSGNEGTSIVVAALVGSVANVAAFVVISAIVTDFLNRVGRDLETAVHSSREVWNRRRELFSVFARSYVIVFVLLSTVVLAPLGVRQLVRYQFGAQAVMAEGRVGEDALRRSSTLVTGRWWHTAIMVVVVNAVIAVSALGLALLLLVSVTGLPLWAFSALSSLVYALVVPLAAIAITLLYGDAAAAHISEDHSGTEEEVDATASEV